MMALDRRAAIAGAGLAAQHDGPVARPAAQQAGGHAHGAHDLAVAHGGISVKP